MIDVILKVQRILMTVAYWYCIVKVSNWTYNKSRAAWWTVSAVLVTGFVLVGADYLEWW
jgi:hypothetical protein